MLTPKPPFKTVVLCAVLTAFSCAQALQAVIMDRDLQTKVGYGTATATKLTLTVAGNYSGPIVLLIAREDNEKDQYSTLQDRYDGFLKNAQLTLKDDDGQAVNLAKLLASYKMSLNVQAAPQAQGTPLTKATDPKSRP